MWSLGLVSKCSDSKPGLQMLQCPVLQALHYYITTTRNLSPPSISYVQSLSGPYAVTNTCILRRYNHVYFHFYSHQLQTLLRTCILHRYKHFHLYVVLTNTGTVHTRKCFAVYSHTDRKCFAVYSNTECMQIKHGSFVL